MDTINEALALLRRQAEIECTMRQAGGLRVSEEQELRQLHRRLGAFPQALRAVMEAAHALRRPAAEVTVQEVERWALMAQAN